MLKELKKETYRSMATLFNNATFKYLLEDNKANLYYKKIGKYKDILIEDDLKIPLQELLILIYNRLMKDYPNEYVIKNTLIDFLFTNNYIYEQSIVYDEFKIGKSIADLVFINGEMQIFEIKSDLDNLQRLDIQLFEYSKVADKINIVAGEKNITQILDLYENTNYGIYEFRNNGSVSIRKRKEGIPDNKNWNYENLFKLLRKDEYSEIVFDSYGFIPNVPNTKFYKECLNLCKQLPLSFFRKQVFNNLKKRGKINYNIYKSFPDTIKLLIYNLKIKEQEAEYLSNLLYKVI